MADTSGASEMSNSRLDFDHCVHLEFHGSKISSNGGLLLFRDLDDILGLQDLTSQHG
jgi:hypothetical protein